ncbi:hypothetical protein AKJ62_00345 [candidate division MSBL1 archaeon SCGC-AAA259D14]|uniref:S-methyl-5-thioribose-1-phosphate isomerase n=2 Tax=candidate division MSBL1 TaxID=215777 RepID=A0A133U905_9EURY|nr:hypothetical protein AKJ62_00345 [candidate division MSBL1 archaeon SCGC-AAA259D14]KXA93855.1 hypothetical protein AKJ66_00745 [candidate division MSBL1 archaeon SCGC-AAA259E22]
MTKEELPLLVDLHKNVFFDEEQNKVVILDRRKLPDEITYHECENYEEVAAAIEKMVTQSLGVSPAAGYGIVIAAHQIRGKDRSEKRKYISKAVERIKNTRPTQTSLHHLMDEMLKIAEEKIVDDGKLFEAMRKKAHNWTEKLMEISRKLGKHASEVIEDEDTILTHCYGGPAIYFMGDYAREQGKEIEYFCTETRPYLQGARLTTFALSRGGFPTTLITDGMSAYCMEKGLIDKFITGADRISMDGGVANKIGTYQIALAAREYDIPFYAHSYTGPDPDTPTYKDVEIEMRDPKEITQIRGIRIAPEEIDAFYPAFDCTPPELVKGVVTEKGIYPPVEVSSYFEENS